MTTRVLLVVTNAGHFEADPSHPTGLWLSELTHAVDVFATAGFEQTIASPAGGRSPLEPRSLRFPNYGPSAKAWHEDPARMALLDDTVALDDVDSAGYDAIYLAGGHGAMFDHRAPACRGSLGRSSRAAASSPRSATGIAGSWRRRCRTASTWSTAVSSPGSPGTRRF